MNSIELETEVEERGCSELSLLQHIYAKEIRAEVNKLIGNSSDVFSWKSLWSSLKSSLDSGYNCKNSLYYLVYDYAYKQVANLVRLGYARPRNAYLIEYKNSVPEECSLRESLILSSYLSMLDRKSFNYLILKYYLLEEDLSVNSAIERKLLRCYNKVCKKNNIAYDASKFDITMIKWLTKMPEHFIKQIGIFASIKKMK